MDCKKIESSLETEGQVQGNVVSKKNTEQTDVKAKKNIKKIILAGVVCVIIAALFATNVVCVNHDWVDATCTKPETCANIYTKAAYCATLKAFAASISCER